MSLNRISSNRLRGRSRSGRAATLQRQRHSNLCFAKRRMLVEQLEQRQLLDGGGLTDQWSPLGPTSTSIFALERDPAQDSTLYAGTFFGGLYRSDDSSLSWDHLTSPFSTKTVFAVEVDPNDSDIVFVGTFQDGMYRTVDGGATWLQLTNGFSDDTVQDIAVDPNNSSNVVITGPTGIFRSTDGGDSWSDVSVGLDLQGKSLLFDPKRIGVVFAGSLNDGIFRSVDSGATWSPFSDGLQDLVINSLDSDDESDDAIYATARTAIYRLSDGGNVWEDISYNLPDTTMNQIQARPQNDALLVATDAGVFQITDPDNQQWDAWAPIPSRLLGSDQSGSFVHVVSTNGRLLATLDEGVNPFFPTETGMQTLFAGSLDTASVGDTTVVFAGTDRGLYYSSSEFSTDDSVPWPWLPGFGLDEGIFGVTPHPTELGTIFAGTEFRGVWETNDFGASWTQQSDGITPNLINAISQSNLGDKPIYVGTGQSGLFVSRDNGATWTRTALDAVTTPQVTAVLTDPTDADVAYFGTLSGQIFRTDNGGASFDLVWQDLPGDPINDIARSPNGNLYAVTGSGLAIVSENDGGTWGFTAGDVSEPILTIVADANDPLIAYAGTAGGGVYKTVDSGASWQAATTGLNTPFVFALAIAPSNQQRIYAATVDQVYVTSDGGLNWSDASSGLPSGIIPNIAVDPDDPDTVYASVRDAGVFKSTDGGATWTASNIAEPFRGNLPLVVSTVDGDSVLVGTDLEGIYRTDDAGGTWASSSSGMTLFVRTVALDESNPDVLYAGTFGGGVFKTIDGGDNWENVGLTDRNIFKVSIDPHDNQTIFVASTVGVARSNDGGQTWVDLGQRANFLFDIAEDPTDPDVFYISSVNGLTLPNGVIKTSDGGVTWQRVNTGLPNVNIRAITVDATGAVYAAAEQDGIYRSDDGGASWIATDASLIGPATITGLTVNLANGNVLAATENFGVFRTTNGGISWEATFGLSGQVTSVLVDPFNSDLVYATTLGDLAADPGVYASSDGGQSWTPFASGITTSQVHSIAAAANLTGRLYAATDDGVFQSIDGGQNWTLTNTGLAAVDVRSLFVDPVQNDIVYAGTAQNGMFVSTDGGQTWAASDTDRDSMEVIGFAGGGNSSLLAATAANGVIRSQDNGQSWGGSVDEFLVDPIALFLALDPVTPGIVYATTSGVGVIKSVDGGNNWQVANQGLTNTFSLALAIDNQNPETLYAGTTGGGVFVTDDGGDSWSPINTGLFNTNVTALTIDPLDSSIIFAGTEGGSVFGIDRDFVPAVDADDDGVDDNVDLDPSDPDFAFPQLLFTDGDSDGDGDFDNPIIADSATPVAGQAEWGNDPDDTNAQIGASVIPQGQRVLGVDLLSTAQNGEFHAPAVVDLPIGAAPLQLTWQGIETTEGSYDGPQAGLLQTAVDVYGDLDVGVSLTLSPLTSGFATLPDDLLADIFSGAATFADAAVINRFNQMLTHLHQQLAGIEVISLQIGHEIDRFAAVTLDGTFWQNYATFFQAAKTHAESLWGVALPVSTTWTSDGFTSDTLSPLRQLLDAPADSVSITFAPRSDDFSYVNPLLVNTLLSDVVGTAFPKPVYFQSVTAPSAPITGSSATSQSQFIRAFFDFWDASADFVPFASFGSLHDVSRAAAESIAAAEFAGAAPELQDKLVRLLESEGLRKFAGDGTDKAAYLTLQELTTERSWSTELNPTAESTPWQPIGPDNALIFALERDPFDPGTLYAGTYFGGIYRSLDGGFQWEVLESPFSQRVVFDIAADPHNPATLYVATFQDGIYKTTDGGQSWTAASVGLTDLDVQDVEVDPFDPNHLLAATFAGVFRSTDGGQSWSITNVGGDPISAKTLAFDPIEQDIVYLGSFDGRGAMRSVNGGRNWSEFNAGMFGNDVQKLRFDAAGAQSLYATSSSGFVFRLVDDTWELISDGLPQGPVSDIVTNPINSNELYAATGLGVYKSSDGGASWQPSYVAAGDDGLTISFRLTIAPNGNVIHAGNLNGDGLVSSFDGGQTWTASFDGIQNLFVGALATVPVIDSALVFAGSDRGISLTGELLGDFSDPVWFDVTNFPQTIFEIEPDPSSPNSILAGTERRGVYRSFDFGSTWQPSTTGILPRTTNVLDQSALNSQTLLAGTSAGLWISRDSGANWAPTGALAIPSVTSIAQDPNRPGVFLFGTNLGEIYRSPDDGFTFILAQGGLPGTAIEDVIYAANSIAYAVTVDGDLYTSADDGASWTIVPAAGSDVTTIESNPLDGSLIYAGTASGGVLRSTDGGANWVAGLGSIATARIYDIEIDATNPFVLYASSDAGVFQSTDAGTNWTALNNGLPAQAVRDLVIDSSNSSNLWVTVEDAGLYQSIDGGANWFAASAQLPGTGPVPIVQSRTEPGQLFAGPQHGGVFTSGDAGSTWTPISNGISLFVRAIEFDPQNSTVVYAGSLNDGVFRSVDGGFNWTALGLEAENTVFDLEIDPFDTNIIYVATAAGLVVSFDGGASFSDPLGPLFTTGTEGFILSLEVDPTDASLYAATGGAGLWKSVDRGFTWEPINDGIEVNQFLSLLIDTSDPDTIYAGSVDGGVFVTEDGGQQWRALNDGLFNQTVTALAIDPFDNNVIYAGTEGGGTFRNDRAAQSTAQTVGDVLSVQTGVDAADFDLENGVIARVEFQAEDVVRVRINPSGALSDRLSGAIAADGPEPLISSIVDTPERTELRTDSLTVLVYKSPFRVEVTRPDGTVLSTDIADGISYDPVTGQISMQKEAPVDREYYGLGLRGGPLDRRGDVFEGRNTDAAAYNEFSNPLYSTTPFYLGRDDTSFYGLFFDNPAEPFIDFDSDLDGKVTIGAALGELDYYVFAGPTPNAVLESYSELTGFSALPAKWTLGFQQSRYGYDSFEEIQQIADTFRELEIPADAIYFDLDYMQDLDLFSWDPVNFPDPLQNNQLLHDLGFRTVNIVDPTVQPDDPLYADLESNGFFIKDAQGNTLVNAIFEPWEFVSWLDFSNPDAAQWYIDMLKQFVGTGVSAIWNDLNEPAQNNMPEAIYDYAGQQRTDLEARNIYALTEVALTHQALLEANPNERPYILSRSGYPGIQRYAANWSGDTLTTFDSLRVSVQTSIHMATSGQVYFGHDIGGFLDSPSPELFTRWLEFGSFTPFFRNHALNTTLPSEPWQFGEPYTSLAREVINQRYQLLPYVYTEAEEASRTGDPILEPVFFEFPDDENVYDLDDQFMWGDSMLVAPVYQAGATDRTVYLPEGSRWFDWNTGLGYDPGIVTVQAPLGTIPVFVKEGSIIPTNPVRQHVAEEVDPRVILDIYPGDTPGDFVLYEDDGESFDYQSGEFLRTQISSTSTPSDRSATIEPIDGDMAVPDRPWFLRFRNVLNDRLIVNHDSQELASVASLEELESVAEGWFYDADEFVLTVRIAGSTDATTVDVQQLDLGEWLALLDQQGHVPFDPGFAQDQWVAQGPNQAVVFAMQQDPFDASHMLAGTFFGGLYESNDNGQTWQPVTTPFAEKSVFDVEFDPQRAGVYFVATFEEGIYTTINGGQTWLDADRGITDPNVQSIAIDPFDSNNMLATTFSGVFQSSNGGLSWSISEQSGFAAKDIAYDPVNPSVVYASALQAPGVYRSDDGGTTWAPFNSGLGQHDVQRLHFSPAAGNHFYAVSSSGDAYRFDTDSATWQSIDEGLPKVPLNDIHGHPDDPQRLFVASDSGIYTSPDGGNSWFSSYDSGTYSRQSTLRLTVDPETGRIHAGNLNGIGLIYSDDLGETWVPAVAGFQNLFVGAFEVVNTAGSPILYAGSDQGLFYAAEALRTEDGLPWIAPGGGDTLDLGIFTLKAHPTEPGTLFAGTERRGVWRTTDWGQTWEPWNSGIVPLQTYDIVQSRNDADVLLAGTSAGLWISRDGGEEWNETDLTIPAIHSLLVDPYRNRTVYVGTDTGLVYRSTNDGDDFVLADGGLPGEQIEFLEISSDGRLYAITELGDLFFSDDRGGAWSLLRQAGDAPAATIAADPLTPSNVYLGTFGGGMLRSFDGGFTWTPVDLGDPNVSITEVVFDPAGSIYAGSDDGIYKSVDFGQTFNRLDVGLPVGRVYQLVVDSTDAAHVWASIRDAGLYESFDGGLTWNVAVPAVELPADGEVPILQDRLNPDQLYAGVRAGGVWTSTDQGATWDASTDGISLFIRGLAIDSNNPDVMYAASLKDGIFKSFDGGETWNNTGLIGVLAFDIAVDPGNSNNVFLATGSGVVYSNDGGGSWLPAVGPFLPGTDFAIPVLALEIESTTGTLYAATQNGGFRSVDSGFTWQHVTAGLTADAFLSVALDPDDPQTVYLGSVGKGVFISEDGGDTWTRIAEGLFSQTITALKINPDDPNLLYVGTEGGGVFTMQRSGAALTPVDRTFNLGFTTLPPDFTEEALDITYGVIAQGGDLVAHNQQEGVPWLEALNSSNYLDYSEHLQNRWNVDLAKDEQFIPDHVRYLMINPIETSYERLAPYWDDDVLQPLPEPFASYAFDHPDVKQAYTNYLIAAIEFWDPKFVAVGIEANILLAKRPDLWEGYKELNQHVYETIKGLYPELTVFTTIHYEHMLGLLIDSKNLAEQFSETRPDILEEEVRDILRFSDIVAVSTYPYMVAGLNLTDDYYDPILQIAEDLGKPVAFDQTAYISQDLYNPDFDISLPGNETLQNEFISYVLEQAQEHSFEFVVNFNAIDYGFNFGTDPTALTWAFAGLLNQDGSTKQAFDVWTDSFLLDYEASGVDVNPPVEHQFFFDVDGDQFGDTGGPIVRFGSTLEAGEVIWANDPDDADIFNIPQIVPQGNRQIGIGFPVGGVGDADWESRARELGAEAVSHTLDWSDIETGGQLIGPGLDDLTSFNDVHADDFLLNLTLTPFRSGQLSLPSDLVGGLTDGTLRWNNPSLIDRFEFVLDAVHARLPDTKLSSLQIGHEVDLYTDDPLVLFEYAIFLDEIRSYAKQLWGPELPVAATLTYEALTGPEAANVSAIIDVSDFVSVVYNGHLGDYQAIQPADAIRDLGTLIAGYFQNEIRFQEVNFPSSALANSSQYKQAQFMHGLFDVWDSFPTVIKYVGLPSLEDATAEAALAKAISLPTTTTENLGAAAAFTRSLGLWTDGDDAEGEKSAFHSLRQLTFDRGWWQIEERDERSFLIGLTPFPYDHNPEGDLIDEVLDNLYQSVESDADLVVYHFDKGVPWVEALADDFSSSELPYSDNVIDVWNDYRSRENPRSRVAVGINPLGIPRDGLAPYWGFGESFYHDEDFNQVPTGEFLDYEDRVLPGPWGTYRLNSTEVKTAFVNYAKRVVEFFDPEYLFTGIEVNLAAITDAEFFDDYVELQQHVYDTLRADPEFDDVQILVSFTGEHFLRDQFDVPILFDGVVDPTLVGTNLDALERLLPAMDIVGLSLYPQKSKYAGTSLPPQLFDELFDVLRERTDKPVAITESGYSSQSFVFQGQPFDNDLVKQERYVRLLMEELAKDGNVEFVTNFSIRDITPHLDKLRDLALEDPPFISQQLVDVFQFFESIGLYEEDGTPKPALQTWRDTLELPIFDTVTVQPVSLQSPDGSVEVIVDLVDDSGQIYFSTLRDGVTSIVVAPIGIEVDGVDLGAGITSLVVESPVEFSETYPIYGKHSEAVNHYNEFVIHLYRDGAEGDQELDLLFRVFDDGAAYQWVIPGAGDREIFGEDSALSFPDGSFVWHQQNTENYESDFRPNELGQFGNTIGGPFTVELPNGGGYVLATEAALRNYSGMSYRSFLGSPFIVSEFLDDESWIVDGGSTSPWRVFAMADDLNTLANTDIVFNLNDAPDPELFPDGLQTDYIQPGKTVWSWWSDFTSGFFFDTQKEYVDYAHELGFEYSLIDIYWEDGFPADGKDQFERLQDLAVYASSDGRDVGLWVWKNWAEITDPFFRRQWMIQVKFAGAVGIKVDNIDSADSESQENVELMEAILREAAELELMVNFHGVPKPTGLARTYPNNITYEGFAASELNGVLWTQGLFHSPLHNATLPFTRFVVGPGDYSPVIFDPLKVGDTTFTHQLALGGLLTSPMLVTADNPENLLAQTDVLDILKGLPTVWDETIALQESDLGSVVAMARRSGEDWYLFVISGQSDTAQFLDNVDLSFLGDGEFDATLIRDPAQFEFDREEIPAIDAGFELDVPLPAGGGFVAKFTPAEDSGRPFRLGFTSVPRTTDGDGFLLTYNMLQNGDLVAHSFQDGVPWTEALVSDDVRDYSVALQQRWDLIKGLDDALIPDHDLYLMLNPLRTSYDQLAPYWGEDENLPLPAPFTQDDINSDLVKTAYTNYVIAAIKYWDPTYVAIGVEANIFLAKRPDLWEDYKDLNAHVYSTVKALYPDVTILTSVHYEHMLGLQDDSKNLQQQFANIRPNLLEEEVVSLLEHSDAVAWSTYPYTSFGNVVTPIYYDQAVRLADSLDKPIAIDQTGYTSQTFTIDGFGQTFEGSEALQEQFLSFILDVAREEDFLFVNNFVSVDYGENYGLGTNLTWAYTGLLDLDLNLKSAFDVWSSFNDDPYVGEYPTVLFADSDGDGVIDRNDAAPLDPALTTYHLFYMDQDGDGFGDSSSFVGVPSLTAPAGYAPLHGDPDDSNPAIVPQVAPIGDRKLGIEFVETTELGSVADNYQFAKALGAQVSSLHLNWAWIEPEPETYVDPNDGGLFPNLAFSSINSQFPANDLGLSLTLRPINAADVPVPSDLEGVAFNDPVFVDRFKTMMDFVFAQLPDVEIFSLQIGNEIDLKLDGDAEFFFNFADFLGQIRSYLETPVEQGGAGYYGRDPFAFGTTATLFGLVNPAFSGLLTAINQSSDVINLTYYPTGDNFVQKDPFFMTEDLDSLVALYPDKPLYIQETGYSSAAITESSELKQTQYVSQFFQLWDKYADNIEYAQFLKLNDSSLEFANFLAVSPPYLTIDPVLSEFLRTTGFRTHDGGGTNKPALNLLYLESAQRGWVAAAQANQGGGQGAESITAGDHNMISPTDVNLDGETTALDALMVINRLGQGEAEDQGSTGVNQALADVNADGKISALDALIVINSLGRTGAAYLPEGEPPAAAASTSDAPNVAQRVLRRNQSDFLHQIGVNDPPSVEAHDDPDSSDDLVNLSVDVSQQNIRTARGPFEDLGFLDDLEKEADAKIDQQLGAVVESLLTEPLDR